MSDANLNLQTRKVHNVELQGNVVIFDEAHNLVRKRPYSDSICLYFQRFLDINGLERKMNTMRMGHTAHIFGRKRKVAAEEIFYNTLEK